MSNENEVVIKPDDERATVLPDDVSHTEVDEKPVVIDNSAKVDDIVIDVVDDTPEEDRGRKRREEGKEPSLPDDDEISRYSDRVQKRIKDLRYEFHEERRAKEEAQRQLNVAIEYAKRLMDANSKQRAALSQGEKLLLSNTKAKIEAELDRVRSAFKAAHEAGDSEALVKSQEELARLQVELATISSYQPQWDRVPPPAVPAQHAAPQQQADPRALEWHRENPWYGQDEEMTAFARKVHSHLVREGIDGNHKDYWKKLDTAVRARFPDRVAADEEDVSKYLEAKPQAARNGSQVVAGVTRTSPNEPRRVVLTESELKVAKKMGVTPQMYAAEKLKMMGR